MSETSGHHELENERTNSDEIMVGWKVRYRFLGSTGSSPVTRKMSDAERAMTNMFRLAEGANNFQDCSENFERAVKICREYDLQLSPPPFPDEGGGPAGHQARMDAWRAVMTGVLVLGVLVIVGWSLRLGNANATALYVAPVSGLAGICLGWLFTNQPRLQP